MKTLGTVFCPVISSNAAWISSPFSAHSKHVYTAQNTHMACKHITTTTTTTIIMSVLIQRFNAVLLHDSFVDEEAETGIPA